MGMKAVGLVSGGKDSIFAMHCARELGHHICAVASLLPRNGHLETDSYMYQSVGTEMTASIAECIGVPYFSARVRGHPVATETLSYETTKGDEVEDLHDLLLRVKNETEGLQAVTCGAILSEYQRRRLEHVCQRLGLVPICLMWKREQEDLLNDMIEWGLHAVLVKTASMGLSRSHLGCRVSELLPHFISLKRKYDFHVCGEGGEYETLTLDCPLFKKGSIVVSEWRDVCQNEDAVAAVCLLSPVKWSVLRKEPLDDSVPAGDTEMLHAIELRRFQPYRNLIKTAVNKWSSRFTGYPNTPTALGSDKSYPQDSGDPCEEREWGVQIHNTSSCCFATADVSVCSGDEQGERCHIIWSSKKDIPLLLKESILRALRQWIDKLLRGSLSDEPEAKSASPVHTICQARDSGLIPIVYELFASRSVAPHPITFVVTPLPQGILLRFRIVLGCPNDSVLPDLFDWKTPADDAVLHVHSLNWWLPPCHLGDDSSVICRLRSKCCTCQSVRCESAPSEPNSVACVFLRGCDARFPHSGILPNPACNPLLRDIVGESGRDAEAFQALDTSLQVVNSFLNMQQTLRLSKGGGAVHGFLDVAYQLGTELLETDQALTWPAGPPPCILTLVNLGHSDVSVSTETKFESECKLAVIKELVEGLVEQVSKHGDLARSRSTEKRSIVTVAEVSSLPGDAKILMLPIWEVGELGCLADEIATLTCVEKLQPEGAWWEETVTSLRRIRRSSPNAEASSLDEKPDTASVHVLVSFTQCARAIDNQVAPSHLLLQQLCGAVDRELQKLSVRGEGVLSKASDGSIKSSGKQAVRRVLDISVIYSVACASQLWADLREFETECLDHIRWACRQQAFESPHVTLLPVRNLSTGVLEIILCSTNYTW